MTVKFIKLIIFLNVILIAGQFFITSRRATDGSDIAKLEVDLGQISFQNEILKSKIYGYSSISAILDRAIGLGLKPGKITYISPLSIASINSSHP